MAMARSKIEPRGNLLCIDPVGYLDFAALLRGSHHVVTDSGGVQKEAFFHDRPCTTMRDSTEWPETLRHDWNRLTGADPKALIEAFSRTKPTIKDVDKPFGDGTAGSASARVLFQALRT